MSQLGKMLEGNLDLRQSIRNIKNSNKTLAPKQIFALTYRLQASHVKSEARKLTENSNFLNAAYRYCRAGIDDSFKQELHYISNGKFNL